MIFSSDMWEFNPFRKRRDVQKGMWGPCNFPCELFRFIRSFKLCVVYRLRSDIWCVQIKRLIPMVKHYKYSPAV